MFTQLSKTETEVLESDSTPVINVFPYDVRDLSEKYFKILGWAHANGVEPNNTSIYARWRKMSEILGFKQHYCVTYNCRNAVWGLRFEDTDFLIYVSIEGFRLQISPESHHEGIINLLEKLYTVLIPEDAPEMCKV